MNVKYYKRTLRTAPSLMKERKHSSIFYGHFYLSNFEMQQSQQGNPSIADMLQLPGVSFPVLATGKGYTNKHFFMLLKNSPSTFSASLSPIQFPFHIVSVHFNFNMYRAAFQNGFRGVRLASAQYMKSISLTLFSRFLAIFPEYFIVRRRGKPCVWG